MAENAEWDASIGVVVGLGNPGGVYEATRHNAGFLVVDLLAQRFGIPLGKGRFSAVWGKGPIEGRDVVLVKPTTFMNRSGEAVAAVLDAVQLTPDRMLVINDDLDLPCGRLKLARGGGAAGHRGVASIKDWLEDQDFPRLKLGIGRPLLGEAVEEFVLASPYPDQMDSFQAMVTRGAEVVVAVLAEGLTQAMNRFNRREVREPESQGESPPSGSGGTGEAILKGLRGS